MGRPREVTDQQILAVARKCFLEHGAGVPAAQIARALDVSHTTLFNRFGSKEGLMVAALGAPDNIAWIEDLEAGPDDRPLREQLLTHAKVMAVHFQEVQLGQGVLAAAGIDAAKLQHARPGGCASHRAFAALVAWIERAQRTQRLAVVAPQALAATLLGSLHSWSLTKSACATASKVSDEQFVEQLVDLLWAGIRPPRAKK